MVYLQGSTTCGESLLFRFITEDPKTVSETFKWCSAFDCFRYKHRKQRSPERSTVCLSLSPSGGETSRQTIKETTTTTPAVLPLKLLDRGGSRCARSLRACVTSGTVLKLAAGGAVTRLLRTWQCIEALWCCGGVCGLCKLNTLPL